MKLVFGDIGLRIDGHVAIATIDRPPLNFIGEQFVADLGDALEAIDANRNLRVTVLAANGKAFCAGAAGGQAGQAAASSSVERVARLFAIHKPVVAAIQGAAVGAGLGLALTADFRIAAPEARFAANFVQLGLHPGFALSLTLPRVVGEQRAALMLLSGRRIKPDAALSWGLVDAVVPAEELIPAALSFARELAANAPLAIVSTRATLRIGLVEAVRQQLEHELREQQWLRGTSDFAEGLASVAERRPGVFRGE